jgi:hypothetical protein
MRHLVTVILVMLVLGAVVTGCDGTRRYDSRLTAVDSLMRSAPDSALALVEAISRDSLTSEADRAYRDLLLTQARYRCYITATSDSDINRALAWYRAHPADREKLTRAYIYKGAVMEELGHPDSAMLYYKTAEATADTTDYHTMGYINLRIADLYRKCYGNEQICFEKFQLALRYLELTGDKALQQNCWYNMGMCEGITGGKNSDKYLNKALDLALELNDSSCQFDCFEMRCRQLMSDDSQLDEAKSKALRCLNDFEHYINNDLLVDLAMIYAKEGHLDSADYFINLVDERFSMDQIEQIRVRRFGLLSLLEKKKGHELLSKRYIDSMNIVADQISNDKTQYYIQQIDSQYQNEREVLRIHKIQRLSNTIWALIIGGAVVFLLLIIYYIIESKRIRAIVREARSNHNHDIKSSVLQDKTVADSDVMDKFVKGLTILMQTAIEADSVKKQYFFEKKIRSVIAEIADNNFWDYLRKYLDKRYDNLISNLAENSNINEKDIRFIELACCGFNYVEIAVALNYNPKYISNKRRIIAKKLNLDTSLQDYLNRMMTSKTI